ncbi:hypothetical protein JB92DRAFT_2829646 [Gautieria morchelliformis]|nr:hypothetical protein JB92DRAFT_2829646 [Gautieria morchelliformis]
MSTTSSPEDLVSNDSAHLKVALYWREWQQALAPFYHFTAAKHPQVLSQQMPASQFSWEGHPNTDQCPKCKTGKSGQASKDRHNSQTVGQPDTSQGQSSGLLSTSSVPLTEEVAISKLQYMLPVSQLSLDGHLQQALSQKAIDGWQLLNDEGSDEDNSTPEDDMMYGWVPDFEDSSPMELPPTPPPPTLNGACQPSTSEGRESMELNDDESPTANQAISATSTAMATRTTKACPFLGGLTLAYPERELENIKSGILSLLSRSNIFATNPARQLKLWQLFILHFLGILTQ